MTEILNKAGSRTVEIDGKRVAGRRLVARYAWELLTKGKTVFPDGTELTLAPKDWLELVRWVYAQVDGPPPTKLEHSGIDGGPIALIREVVVEMPGNEQSVDARE